MIVSVGIDMTEVARIERSIARFGSHFLHRVFTDGERTYCAGKANAAERFAARFAAKEAAMKALGTGWSGGIRWVDIEVARANSGKPSLLLHGKAKERAQQLGIRRFELSLTHTHEYALAQVIAES
jgi:holo-[acyl-carrier protein] synthase